MGSGRAALPFCQSSGLDRAWLIVVGLIGTTADNGQDRTTPRFPILPLAEIEVPDVELAVTVGAAKAGAMEEHTNIFSSR